MATQTRYVILSPGGGRRPDYYTELDNAVTECESLNSGISNPEQDGYVVVQAYVGDWTY